VLGDIILQHTGKVSDIRIVDSERKKKENSVRATGLANRIGEVAVNMNYWNIQCTEGLYYGEGKGEITSKESGDKIKVTEYGVGRVHGQKSMWRGSAFYQSLHASVESRLYSLHGLVGVFETEVDEAGNVIEKVWEWK
jgi:hypothetical protein